MSRTWISAGLVSTALTLLTSTAFATDFPEVEPNGTKAEATPVAGLVAGDTISGVCQGTSTTAANVAVTSADTFDLSTAGQAIPGWYEWTLTITTSAGTANSMSVRGVNSVTGTACVVGATAGTTDSTLQSSTGGVIRWYSNEQPSRLLVRVTGSASSASYSAVLGCTPVAAPNAGTYAPGNITITTRGLTHTPDPEIAVYDSSRNLIPGWRNDDTCPTPVTHTLGSTLTRSYAAGTYYLVISNWQTNNNDPAPADDNFGGGVLTDFSNAIVNNSTTTTNDCTFSIDDGSGAVVTATAKTKAFDVRIFEFIVGAGNLVEACHGDGGDQMGCTNCPCGNNGAPGTLGGCTNSVGGNAHLIASGTPDVTTPADTLHFDMTGGTFPGSFAVLISGDNQLPNAGACPPGSGITSATLDGLRCVGGAALRHGSRALDNTTGATTNGWGPPAGPAAGIGVTSGFVGGQTRHFQAFYRELGTLGCMTGQNTSNSVSVTFL